ncbi:RNA polymerase sigma factor [Chitinophaga sp. CF418]|uniref:RNA polymerase sigma factor n=1 Tax=Chitinophaga sp. CF418 TaxID=1855287 RepID=UPI00091B26ED|nr:sigma-70 family RNA polymerase sigma factor [Chitinophaga sp. CF418]SHN45740.1 RNA polymerase sigma-70 factor, Bacteroides expansion family 1 [Chitinophaga sp. CF418]
MNSLINNYSEDELFQLIQQGSEAAFAVLYQRYLDLLFSRAYTILQNEDEAKDVIQEVLIWLWDHRASVQINTNLKTYLTGAVQLRCADVIRKKANRNSRQQIYASLSTTITGTPSLETKELGNQLHAAMALISPTSRKVFILSYIEKKPLKEIAATMNMKVQTAKNHMQQALKTLRQHLQKN